MRYYFLLIFALFLCEGTDAYANLDVICQATCKVNRATGVVFSQDEEDIWIITAGHCVVDDYGQKEEIKVRFYHTGFQSHPLDARILWHVYEENTTNDLAILKVSKKDFLEYPLPKPIPLGEADVKAKSREVVMSYGCAKASWPTGWKGCVVSVGTDRFKFHPPPLPGRSGSGIFNKEGTYILGIIIWQDGTAVSLPHIHKLVSQKQE
jgi:hypothetical protein